MILFDWDYLAFMLIVPLDGKYNISAEYIFLLIQ